MALTLKVPGIGESIQEATVGVWKKAEGDFVTVDEPLVEIESEKATLEVPSPGTGRLKKILRKQGDTVAIGEALAEIDDSVTSAGAGAGDEKAQGGKAAQDAKSTRDGSNKGAAPVPASNGSQPVAASGGGAAAGAPVPAAAAAAVTSSA